MPEKPNYPTPESVKTKINSDIREQTANDSITTVTDSNVRDEIVDTACYMSIKSGMPNVLTSIEWLSDGAHKNMTNNGADYTENSASARWLVQNGYPIYLPEPGVYSFGEVDISGCTGLEVVGCGSGRDAFNSSGVNYSHTATIRGNNSCTRIFYTNNTIQTGAANCKFRNFNFNSPTAETTYSLLDSVSDDDEKRNTAFRFEDIVFSGYNVPAVKLQGIIFWEFDNCLWFDGQAEALLNIEGLAGANSELSGNTSQVCAIRNCRIRQCDYTGPQIRIVQAMNRTLIEDMVAEVNKGYLIDHDGDKAAEIRGLLLEQNCSSLTNSQVMIFRNQSVDISGVLFGFHHPSNVNAMVYSENCHVGITGGYYVLRRDVGNEQTVVRAGNAGEPFTDNNGTVFTGATKLHYQQATGGQTAVDALYFAETNAPVSPVYDSNSISTLGAVPV